MNEVKEFEVTLPETMNAADWNQAIAEGAAKAGVEIPRDPESGRFVAAAAATDKKEPEADKIYESTLNVNGTEMVFRGKDAADVLQQYSAAVTAAQLASAKPAEVKKEETKPAFTEAELFDISLGLQQGKTDALDKYIENSGVIGRYLEKNGISIPKLKKQTDESQKSEMDKQWTSAAKDFIEKTPDFQATEQHNYIIGTILGELKLTDKPSVDSYEKAYELAKKRSLITPGTAAAGDPPPPKKEPKSGTAVGNAGTHENRQSAIDHGKKYEIDLTSGISIREASESYNQLIAAGVKPENISYKR
jgi:hypothetical protein